MSAEKITLNVEFEFYPKENEYVMGKNLGEQELVDFLKEKLNRVFFEMENNDGLWWHFQDSGECCEHEAHENYCACCMGECDKCATTDPMEMTDAQADADTLASAGHGTDEDYGYYGEE